MLSLPGSRASLLRQELIARNRSYATLNALPHVMSYGELPVVVYQQSECGRHHGNFIPASYRAILGEPRWRGTFSRRYMLRAGAVCQSEMDRGMSSILR